MENRIYYPMKIFLNYVVWQPLYMQTVTSAENGSTEKADFQVPNLGV